MHKPAAALVFAGAVHPHQKYGADIAAGISLKLVGVFGERIQPRQRPLQRHLPVAFLDCVENDRQFNHLGVFQRLARNIDENIGMLGFRRGRKFKQKSRIEIGNGGPRLFSISFVALVQHHDGTDEPQCVFKALFDKARHAAGST